MEKAKGKSRRKSAIIGILDAFGSRCRAALANSALGNFFTSYDRANALFEKSMTYSAAQRVTHSEKLSKFRRSGSSKFDNSLARRAVLSLTNAMRHCTMRFYGVFMLTFSLYVALMYLIRKFGGFSSADISYIIVGSVVALLSLPLLFEKKKTLGTVLLDSKLFSWLLFDFFELRYENFRDKQEPINRISVAFISGLVLGCLSFFISPIALLLLLAFLLYFYFTLVSPEAGLLLCLFFIPFLSVFSHPTVMLCVFVLCISFSYVCKLFRRKRIFCFGVLEALVVLFMFFVFFAGTRNASNTVSSVTAVYLVLMCGFFLVSNLLRTKGMIKHAARAFAISSVLCALAGIAEYLLGMASLDWIDTEMFASIEGRAVSFFENPNVLGTYLCFGAPLTLSLMSVSKEKKKSGWFAGFLIIVVCAVLTWSRGAWLGLAASVVLTLACTRHFFAFTMTALFCVPFVPYIIPSEVIERFSSIGNTADSSTMYRLNIWRGCCDMAGEYALGGIGIGEDAFLRVYPQFAVAGAETAYHSHSLWLQILLMLGVCGFAVFVIIMFFFAQRSFTALRHGVDMDTKYILVGAFCGVFGLLVGGLFDYTWYNYRVFFIFFAIMGLVCACDRACRDNNGGLHEYGK